MAREVENLSWPDPERGRETVSQVPQTRCHVGDINSEYQYLISSAFGAPNKIQRQFFGLADLELEPGVFASARSYVLNAAGSSRGQA